MDEIQYDIVDKLDEQTKQFDKDAWIQEDVRRDLVGTDWQSYRKYITAKQGEEVVGLLDVKFKAGIGNISSVIVSEKARGHGVGKTLMLKCEELAKEMKIHKLMLLTRPDYKEAYPLYLKLGYSDDYVMKKHFLGKDYHLMSKLL